MGPLHLKFGATITELSIFQTICLLSKQSATALHSADRYYDIGMAPADFIDRCFNIVQDRLIGQL